VSDQVLRLMGEVRDGEMLPRFLPVNPYAAPLGVRGGGNHGAADDRAQDRRDHRRAQRQSP
jgi:hypothetical protein